MSFVTLENS